MDSGEDHVSAEARNKCKVQSAEWRVQSGECRVQSAEFRVQSLELERYGRKKVRKE